MTQTLLVVGAFVVSLGIAWRQWPRHSDSLAMLKELLAVSSPRTWLGAAGPFLVGAWLASGELRGWMVVGVVFFLFPYNLARLSTRQPKRAELGAAREARRQGIWQTASSERPVDSRVWAAACSLPFVAYLLGTGQPASRWWLALLVMVLILGGLRSVRMSEIPVLDTVLWGSYFWGPLVYGTLLGGSGVTYHPALAAFVLWGMGTGAYLSLVNVSQDRLSRRNSIAVAYGERGTLYYGLVCYGLATVIPALGYGTIGIIIGALMTAYLVNMWVATHGRGPASSRMRRGSRVIMRLNVLVGVATSIALFWAYNPFVGVGAGH
jgi:4-hydroxybenzoate polyprenyltransferase